MLTLNNVRKDYDKFHLDCSLEVKPGCVTGLVGANGAGKSTTFKAILDLIDIDGGDIKIFGKDYKQITSEDKEDIGVVLGKISVSGYLTIRKAIPMLNCMYKMFNKDKFTEQCERFELPMNKKIKEFSTGMLTRLNLLIAMSHEAKLLILDEPTAGLDVIARDDLLGMLRRYMEEEGRSILISSHISSDLEGFCDDIYMIHKGSVIFHEDTDTLLDEYGLLKVNEEEYHAMDKAYVTYNRKEPFGYLCLTSKKQYYLDNYPAMVVEKSSIDDFVTIVERGEKCEEKF